MTDQPSHAYRVELPMLVDDAGLSVYAFRLYVHIKRVAGDAGTCWESTRTLAERCGMSIGQVSKARTELIERGWVTQGLRHVRGGSVIELAIVDKWAMNEQTYRKGTSVQDTNTTSESVHHMNALAESVHDMNAGVHHMNAGVHTVNERRSIEEDPKKNHVAPASDDAAPPTKKTQAPKADVTPAPIRQAIADACGAESGRMLARVNKAAKAIWARQQERGRTAEQTAAGVAGVVEFLKADVYPFNEGQPITPEAIEDRWLQAAQWQAGRNRTLLELTLPPSEPAPTKRRMSPAEVAAWVQQDAAKRNGVRHDEP